MRLGPICRANVTGSPVQDPELPGPGDLHPQFLGLINQDPHAGPPLEQLVDFPHERPGPGQD